MIDEQVLERALHADAQTFDVPPHGPDRIRARAAVARRRPSWKWAWAGVAAAAVVGIASVASVTPGTRSSLDTASGPQSSGSLDEGSSKDAYQSGGGAVAPIADQAKVVRTGAMSVEVADGKVPEALRALTALAGAKRGYVSESKTDGSPERPSGVVTLRVPTTDFDATVAEAGRLGKVLVSSTEGVDVTGEVTDVAARLKSLVAARAQLEALLARAKDVGEVLAVQAKITETQTQIEQLQARQASLADRTTYATLRVEVVEPGAFESSERTGFAKAWHDAVDGFLGGVRGLVAASGTIAFVLLLGLAAWLLGRPLYRAYVRRVV